MTIIVALRVSTDADELVMEVLRMHNVVGIIPRVGLVAIKPRQAAATSD